MKRRLILMRHAKSSWKSGAATDHERPLNDRGRRDAPQVANRLIELGWVPERVLSSDSRRTEETLELMQPVFGRDIPAQLTRTLYGAGAAEVRAAVSDLSVDVASVLVLGHNPGWEEAAHYFSGQPIVMKTACAVLLETDAPTWKEAVIHPASWRIVDVIRPKEL